jgi:hypothetical protein
VGRCGGGRGVSRGTPQDESNAAFDWAASEGVAAARLRALAEPPRTASAP